MEHNLARGDLMSNMLRFSVPFLLSFFLQTLYGLADLFIAGQFNGADVISAISIGSQIMHMVTVMLVSLSMGATVMIGRMVGAGDSDGRNRMIGNTITLFTIVAAAAAVLLLLLKNAVIRAMSVPEAAVGGTGDYLTICFAGIPFIVFYNVISAVFRGLGDSKSPMIYVSVACLINIGLDIIFMGPLAMGAAGAAWGTVLAQLGSVLFALNGILRKKLISITRKDLALSLEAIGGILRIGVPIACQDGFIQISFLLITVIANRRGLEISAAVGIVEKTISFLFLFPSAMLSTVSTIAAQCIGAGDMEKAKRTLYYGICMDVAVGLLFTVLFQFIGNAFFGLFTGDIVVRLLAVQYMHTYVADCIFAGIHFPFSGFFSASGRSMLSFYHNLLSVLLFRIPGAWLATVMFPDTLYAMGAAAPMGSLFSAAVCFYFYRKYWGSAEP